ELDQEHHMSRGVKIAALTGLFLAVLGLAYYLRSVFLPFLVALLLAYVLNPLLQRLERHKVPRMASVAAVYVVLLTALAAISIWAIPSAFGQASDFVKVTFLGDNPKYLQLLNKVQPALERAVGPEKSAEAVSAVRARIA